MKANKPEKEKREIAVVSQPESQVDILIGKAIEGNVSVENMQKLLEMRRELKAEWAKSEFDKAMSAFQSECPVIAKVKKGYDYFYAPLEYIAEETKLLRKKYGFSYNFQTKMEAGKVSVICFANHISGHSKSSDSVEMPITNIISNTGKEVMSAPQTVGSATTYAKRYSFINVFGIMTGDEDDDAKAERTEEDIKRQVEEAMEKLKGVMNLNALGIVWSKISGELKANKEIIDLKDKLKAKMTPKVAQTQTTEIKSENNKI